MVRVREWYDIVHNDTKQSHTQAILKKFKKISLSNYERCTKIFNLSHNSSKIASKSSTLISKTSVCVCVCVCEIASSICKEVIGLSTCKPYQHLFILSFSIQGQTDYHPVFFSLRE